LIYIVNLVKHLATVSENCFGAFSCAISSLSPRDTPNLFNVHLQKQKKQNNKV